MRRWGRLVGALAAILPMITGCWDQRPVEGRALVEAIGVGPTAKPGLLEWTFVFPNPTESVSTLGSLPPSAQVYSLSVRAPNSTAALVDAQQETTRDLYFGQFRVLALSPGLSGNTWARIVGSFNRSGRILDTFFVVAADPAGLVVSTPTRSEGAPIYALFKLMACHCQPYHWGQREWKVWDRFVTPGVSPVVPVIGVVQREYIRNRRIAVVGSRRVIPWSSEASAGWAYLTGHVIKGSLTVTADGHKIGLNRVRGSGRLTVTSTRRGVRVSDRLSYQANVEDFSLTLRLTPADKSVIAAEASRAILRLCEQAVRTAEREDVDPFGWHRELWWGLNQPAAPWPAPLSWKDWSTHLSVRLQIKDEGAAR